MKIIVISLKRITVSLLLTAIAFIADAQKQPQVQDVGIRAPENVKIDGNHTEWANPFYKNGDGYLSAYNSANRYYYTIANDDNNLYIVLRGLGTAAAQKALNGGIVFIINHTAGKKPKPNLAGNITITYPLPQDERTTDNIMGPIFSLTGVLPETEANHNQVDSIVKVANGRIANTLKEMRIIGVKEIQDSVISVYNEQGIKAAMQFAKRMPMIEISIPLKYLRLDINNPSKFSYDIRLDGLSLPAGIQIDPNVDVNTLYSISATDISGEYLLAKK